ncbi:hypothetical protein AXG93_3109s1040 [Marchantia polymorpha subsp. ruderalis]|uniref:Uncharacterized protein n=1 Tax=Marchantia polymorpha subsp. ruderalis TaxID=1480154 RepID=A0A176VQJ4_MARPO|nr:hypothetical protein AXG93_3109s1040 [Marchantia polymorpha subsp. ruderalis]
MKAESHRTANERCVTFSALLVDRSIDRCQCSSVLLNPTGGIRCLILVAAPTSAEDHGQLRPTLSCRRIDSRSQGHAVNYPSGRLLRDGNGLGWTFSRATSSDRGSIVSLSAVLRRPGGGYILQKSPASSVVACLVSNERLSPALSSSLEEGRRRGAEERWTEETTAAVAAAAGFSLQISSALPVIRQGNYMARERLELYSE